MLTVEGGTLSAQRVLPGRSEDNPSPAVVEAMVECVAAKAGIGGPQPADDLRTWGAFVVRMLAFALDLDGHDQPIWDLVDEADFEPPVLRAYVAHLALKCTDWAIRHHPEDVARQLHRAERIFDRYEV